MADSLWPAIYLHLLEDAVEVAHDGFGTFLVHPNGRQLVFLQQCLHQ
jgi:hypothetical protein